MKKLFFISLHLFIFLSVMGQNYIVPITGINTATVYPGSSIIVRDAGNQSYYPSNCMGQLLVTASNGMPIHITGTYNTENFCDVLTISDNFEIQPTSVGSFSGSGYVDICCYSGSALILFVSDNSTSLNGFELTVSTCNSYETGVQDVTCIPTENSLLLNWSDYTDSEEWTVIYGTQADNLSDTVTVEDSTLFISGLEEYTRYFFHISNGGEPQSNCQTKLYSFMTDCSAQTSLCQDFSNLNSCITTARYGVFNNPELIQGVVDNGPFSRHTIHTDTNEYDARTGYGLKTVPPGYSSSVRLGNWISNSQAESITYRYHVDTLRSDLLIMKYAAVLQDPSHSNAEQPSFSFQILDSTGNEIDATCYSANFIANSSLGWNIHDSITLWKDWTSVGVDLTPLHGEDIFIKLTTRDCANGAHFGYAYFVFDCTFKTLASSDCGNAVENTFTAPDGFGYRWYNSGSPEQTLSSDRSLHVTSGGTYQCQMSFVGAPSGANCSFLLTAIAGNRFPTAQFSYLPIDSTDCMTAMQFYDNSLISTDSAHQQLTTQPCENVQWLFDDSIVTDERNPVLHFLPGWHHVQMVAYIGGGCSDTVSERFYVSNPCQIRDTVQATICQGISYQLFDTVVMTAGIYIRDSAYLHRTLMLNVVVTDTIYNYDTTVVENDLPITWHGHTFDTIASTNVQSDMPATLNYQVAAIGSSGCDSVTSLTIFVWRNVTIFVDSSICENSLPVVWNGVVFNDDDTATVQFVNQHGADSLLTMRLHVMHNSSATVNTSITQNALPFTLFDTTFTNEQISNSEEESTTFYGQYLTVNHQGCDSTIHYSLTVWHNVAAEADSTLCENSLPLVWNNISFSSDDSATVTLTNHNGADSLLTMKVHILRNSITTIADTVIENNLPVNIGGQSFNHAILDTSWTIPNSVGCDSVIHYSLHIWNNFWIHLDSTICDNMLPINWCDNILTGAGTTNLYYLSQHSTDSTVTLTLTVNSTYSVYDSTAVCDGDTDEYGFSTGGDYEISLQTVEGCDSLLHLNVTVYPVYDIHDSDTICDNQFPYIWRDTTIMNVNNSISTFISRLSTQQGCDSLLSLLLTVHPTNHNYESAVVCDGNPFTWKDGITYYTSTYEPFITYSNRYGCDSVLHLVLNLDDGFKASMHITPDMVDYNHYEVRLQDISNSRTREWYILDDKDTARITLFHYPIQTADSVEVLMVARNNTGCVDSVWGIIHADRSVLWTPNVFTPDEATNNLFFVSENDLASGHVWIYDRQGVLVTHFEALNGSWDGTMKGKACPQGSYAWILNYTTIAQPNVERHAKGTVTLLR